MCLLNSNMTIKQQKGVDNAQISFLIPAYNESETIGSVVFELKQIYPESEIVVVDDGSKDETGKIATEAGAIVITHPYNIGNGAAVKAGIRAASREYLILMDADRQHHPDDVELLLQHLTHYDMVVGARTKGGHASGARAMANRFFNRFGSYVAKFNIQDLTSGFRAIKTGIAKQFIYLLPNTYSYPTTLTLSVLRGGLSVKYVPVSVEKRKKGKSNIRNLRDGVRFLMIIIKICTLYSPLRVFLPVSFATFAMGVLYYLYTFLRSGRFTNMGALLFTTSLLIFLLGMISEQICQMRFERSEQKRRRDDQTVLNDQ